MQTASNFSRYLMVQRSAAHTRKRLSNMKLEHVLWWLIVGILMAGGESLKVIFARNSTARAMRLAEAERLAKQRESPTDMSTIINVPTSCKPGFVYESQFHNRCRRVAG